MSRPETDLDLGDEDSVGGVTSMVTSNLVPADQLLKKKQVVFSGRQLIKDGTIFGTGGTGVLLVLVGIAVFYSKRVHHCRHRRHWRAFVPCGDCSRLLQSHS